MLVCLHRQVNPARLIAGRFLILYLLFAFGGVHGQKSIDKPSNPAYDNAIRNADNLILSGSYMQAINEYERAWVLYPRQKYPEKKIDQIYKTLGSTQLSLKLFGDAVKVGDSCFNVQNYKCANEAYYDAVRLNPEDQYVKGRLNEISKLFTDPENETRYRIMLIHAEKSLEKKHYNRAIDFYQQALLMKPREAWLVRKTEEVTVQKEKVASEMDAYTRYLEDSDHLLEQKKLAEARAGYVLASAIHPKEDYPTARIFFIDHLLAFEYTGQQSYASLIKDADRFYKLHDYENAGIHYQQALNMSPQEQYPKSMLRKIPKNSNSGSTSPAGHENPVVNADILSMIGDNEAALIGYRRSLDLFPDDPYLLSRIRELTKSSGAGLESRDAYQIALENGETSLAALNYSKALIEFRYASKLKPDESYPREKMEALQQLIAREKAVKESESAGVVSKVPDKSIEEKAVPEVYDQNLNITGSENKHSVPEGIAVNKIPVNPDGVDKTYQLQVASGDKAFDEKNYNQAITHYNSALEINPEEKYPKEQISAISAIIEKQKNTFAENKTPLVNAGKDPASKESPAISKASEPAIANKPVKNASQEKRSPAITQLKQPDEGQESYNKAISFADQAFNEKNFVQAMNGYKAALRQKPTENYPRQRIDYIDNLQKTLQGEYSQIILSADKSFEDQDYMNATAFYQSALDLMPGQKYPQARILAINAIVSKQNKALQSYQQAIAFADNSFDKRNYAEALAGYQFASGLLPAEIYPKEKIALINTILGQSKEQLVNYHKAIAEADRAYIARDYSRAITGYEAALVIKPAEAYPKQKIAAISVTLDQLKARQDKYNNIIANADEAYSGKDFVAAITAYKTALDVYPGENYPKERIAAINSILKDQKVSQDNYSKSIQQADRAFSSKDYPAAIAAFQIALGYKPDEDYPKERIAVISATISENKEKLDRQYNGYLSQGESCYAGQDFSAAQKAYRIASMIKPDEAYPKQRIEEIAVMLAERDKIKRESYDRAIADADKAFKLSVFDEAIRLYASALEIKPREPYPGQMIYRIRKYMMENSVVEVTSEQFLLKNNSEKLFSFKPVDVRLRSKNYLVIRARSAGNVPPKLYVNYGRDKMKNGGIVFRNINSELVYDFVIDISMQDKWFREDNNWLSLYSENGDIEVSSIRISQSK
ncbi:MAG: hypothetical protein IPH20_23505 [Bacteroidales bacterium]|nr:hypothetical protein [Bacteroidales bacterium]